MLTLGPDAGAFLDRFGLVPREFVGRRAAVMFEWWTPISAMFLHTGWLHLIGNLAYLWIFGAALEARLGAWRFAGFYLACGIVASVLHVASDPGAFQATVGASGAVSGILGATLLVSPSEGVRVRWLPLRVPARALLALWLVLQLLAGLYSVSTGADGTAWWAHLGGFLVGMALARVEWFAPVASARALP